MERRRSCLRLWPEPASGVFERLLQVAVGHAHAREQPEQAGGDDGDEDSPAEGRNVNVQQAEQGQREGMLMRSQAMSAAARASPKTAPEQERTRLSVRSWRTMRMRAGAQSGAHGELFGARGGACEQKIGEVDAGDEQDARTADQRTTSERRSLPLM